MELAKIAGQKPLWSQVYEILQHRIDENEYLQGEHLPTEADLMKEFNVSRVTVRQALNRLEKEEMISRRRGSGTVVLPRRDSISTTIETTLVAVERNDRKDRRVLSLEYGKAPKAAAALFGISPNQPVLILERISLIDQTIVNHHRAYFNPMVPVDNTMDFTDSMYGVLRDAGYPITQINERITGGISDETEMKLFHLKKPAAVMRRVRRGYSHAVPVEYSEGIYIADYYEMTISQKMNRKKEELRHETD